MDTKPRVSANWNKLVEATLNLLVDKEAPCQVVTIYGATGTGKTELLRKVLNQAEVCKRYDSIYVYDWDGGLDLDYDQYKRISLFDHDSSKEDVILFVIEDASDLTVKSHSKLLESIQKQLLNNEKNKVLATSQRSIFNLFRDVQAKELHI